MRTPNPGPFGGSVSEVRPPAGSHANRPPWPSLKTGTLYRSHHTTGSSARHLFVFSACVAEFQNSTSSNKVQQQGAGVMFLKSRKTDTWAWGEFGNSEIQKKLKSTEIFSLGRGSHGKCQFISQPDIGCLRTRQRPYYFSDVIVWTRE